MNVKRGGRWFGIWFEFSSVTSRKLTIFSFASTVIFRLFLANNFGIFLSLLSLSPLVFG